MKRTAAILIVLSALAIPVSADDFDSLAKGVESHYGSRRIFPHLIGFALFFAKPATWGSGVGGLKVAVFESENRSFNPSISELDKVVRESIGRQWQPFVRVDSRIKDEATVVYTSFAGKHLRMLLATVERGDISVVHMKIKGKALARWMDDPEGEAERSAHKH